MRISKRTLTPFLKAKDIGENINDKKDTTIITVEEGEGAKLILYVDLNGKNLKKELTEPKQRRLAAELGDETTNWEGRTITWVLKEFTPEDKNESVLYADIDNIK